MNGLCIAIQLTIACLFELPVLCVPLEQPAVSANLVFENKEGFNRKLQLAKQTGVTAFTTDAHRSKVGDDAGRQFGRGSYDQICATIADASRKRLCILSFHQGGEHISEWYSSALIEQAAFMILVSTEAFGSLPVTPLSMRIPDIYWHRKSPGPPRSADVAARLIPTNIDNDGTAHGPIPSIDIIKQKDPVF